MSRISSLPFAFSSPPPPSPLQEDAVLHIMLEQGGAGGGAGVGCGMLCEADLMTAPVDSDGDGDGADYDAVFM